jgi:hypothetical protein
MKSLRCDKLLKESLEVRDMAKKGQDRGGLTAVAANHHDIKLVFNRYLGHKQDIPGSAQWRMLNDSEKCWICERHIYCVFFWSKNSGQQASED